MSDQPLPPEFPTGFEFIELISAIEEEASEIADHYSHEAGLRLPKTVEGLGTILSSLYRAACCAWGCSGGDHQTEWLAGRAVNQALSSLRLLRAGYYDESLMLTRGIGEVANLLWLFEADETAFSDWREADRKTRLKEFGPAAVRKKLEGLSAIGVPVDRDRYQALCEIGTHPVPALPPGHYSGTGRPVLGGILQPGGLMVAVNELSYAVAVCGAPLSRLLTLNPETRDLMGRQSVNLLRSIGRFTVHSYEDLLAAPPGQPPATLLSSDT